MGITPSSRWLYLLRPGEPPVGLMLGRKRAKPLTTSKPSKVHCLFGLTVEPEKRGDFRHSSSAQWMARLQRLRLSRNDAFQNHLPRGPHRGAQVLVGVKSAIRNLARLDFDGNRLAAERIGADQDVIAGEPDGPVANVLRLRHSHAE